MPKNLYRFDDPTKKPDLSQLHHHRRFLHPRYQGVITDYIFSEGGGTTLFNYAKGQATPTTTGFTGSEWVPGQAIDYTSTTKYFTVAETFEFGNDWSAVAEFEPDLLNLESGFSRNIVGRSVGVGGATMSIATAPAGELALFDGTANQDAGYTCVIGTRTMAVLIHNNAANTLQWFVDGRLTATNTSVTLATSTITHVLGIRGSLTNGRFDGRYFRHRMYNRILSAQEGISLAESPYLEYTEPRVWVFVPSGSPELWFITSG